MAVVVTTPEGARTELARGLEDAGWIVKVWSRRPRDYRLPDSPLTSERVKLALGALPDLVLGGEPVPGLPYVKGDVEGHDFHGNQWTGGQGEDNSGKPLMVGDRVSFGAGDKPVGTITHVDEAANRITVAFDSEQTRMYGGEPTAQFYGSQLDLAEGQVVDPLTAVSELQGTGERSPENELTPDQKEALDAYRIGNTNTAAVRDSVARQLEGNQDYQDQLHSELDRIFPTGEITMYRAGESGGTYSNGSLSRDTAAWFQTGMTGFGLEAAQAQIHEFTVPTDRIIGVGNTAEYELLFRTDGKSRVKGDVDGHDFHGNQWTAEGEASHTGFGGERFASHEELVAARETAQAKFEAATPPSALDRAYAQSRIAEVGSSHYHNETRGNSYDRGVRRDGLLKQFGDGKTAPCVYCGVKMDGQGGKVTGVGLTQDHIFTAVEGGRFTLGNLVPACAGCNSSRGATPWEDIQWS